MEEKQAFQLPSLETERLLLRSLVTDDADDMFAYASDPLVARYVSWDVHPNVDYTRTYLKSVEERYRLGPHYDWGVIYTATGHLIGTCGYVEINREHRRGEIGYALSRAFWGQGIITEAARALVRFGFEELGLYRIEAICEVPNIGSARVMEKIGMRFEGIRRGYAVVKGQSRDMKSYAILLPDYEGR